MSKLQQQDPTCLRKLVASKSFLLFVIVGTSIEGKHYDEMLAENERIVWATVPERT
jgi:hypothetical protein